MAPEDDQLPATGVLLGGGSRPLLETAVAAHGGQLLGFTRRQVMLRPGRSLTVRYSADVSWQRRPAQHETLVAVVDRDGPLPGALVLEADELQVSLFRYPADPLLPGLRAATAATEAADLLGWSTPPTLEARTYRPCERAVVRATSGEIGERYLKVKRPDTVVSLAERQQAMAERAPVPPVLDVHPDQGILVLGALPGTTMREVLRAGGDGLPDPDDVLDKLHALTSTPVPGLRPVRSPASRAPGFARVLGALLPPSRKRLARFIERVRSEEAAPSVAVHGDFHPAQVLIEGGRVRGLLDVDDAGWGRPVDDLATFLGHLANLALDDRTRTLRAYLARTLLAFEALVDPEELHRQTAAVILALATGPHRVQHDHWRYTTLSRIGLAERWLAGEVRTLRSVS